MSRYNLKYKTFDSLLADVMVDFKSFNLENMIEPQELIKVTKWVTKDLGLRIYKTKQDILELHRGKVKLPDDFYIFNYGLLCGEGVVRIPNVQGTNIQEIPYPYPRYQSQPNTISTCTDGQQCPVDPPACGGCNSCNLCCNDLVIVPGYNPLQPYGDPCVKPRVFMDCHDNAFELIQIVSTETRRWSYMLPLRLIDDSNRIACGCPNLYLNCPDQIWMKDNFLHSNLSCGKVYINYEGALEDVNDTLLVPDHEILTEYYEYKLKHRILENLFMNGEDVERRLSYIDNQRRRSRVQAKSLVNMPDFAEIQNMWELNRKAYNSRFVDMFKHTNWISTYGGRRW